MVGQKVVNQKVHKNGTPSSDILNVEFLIEQAQESFKKRSKSGVKKKGGEPFWVGIKGYVRWEKRVHFYDSSGIRRTRLLLSRRTKPRGI